MYGYYSEDTLEAGYEAFDDRLEQIAERDKYPEFDVPDFDGLAADEAYEIELSPAGTVGRARLTSAWRRTVANKDAKAAVALVQTCDEYQKLVAGSPRKIRMATRADSAPMRSACKRRPPPTVPRPTMATETVPRPRVRPCRI